MCSLRTCRSLLHTNNAAEFVAMGSLLTDAPLEIIMR